jgi:hypothetical protein
MEAYSDLYLFYACAYRVYFGEEFAIFWRMSPLREAGT